LRLGKIGQHRSLPAGVDPALEERLDAVGGLELSRSTGEEARSGDHDGTVGSGPPPAHRARGEPAQPRG
jgi:hypothetical protein